jgi:hypothetical protein
MALIKAETRGLNILALFMEQKGIGLGLGWGY